MEDGFQEKCLLRDEYKKIVNIMLMKINYYSFSQNKNEYQNSNKWNCWSDGWNNVSCSINQIN